jgi:hypothetical protein
MGAHLSVSRMGAGAIETKAARPLTTKFVKREPRLTKPLEMKKRPRPRRREIQREMVAVRAKVARQRPLAGIGSASVLGNLARPRAYAARAVDGSAGIVEPRSVAQAVEGTRESRDVVDMSLELMDMEAMDTGRFHAMVVEDPHDKRDIRGFLHIAMPAPLNSNQDRAQEYGLWRTGVQRLAQFVNENTAIRCDANNQISMDSRELSQVPWVYLCRLFEFYPTTSELRNLGQYVLSGGFFWGDSFGQTPIYVGGYTSVVRTIVAALATQGLVHAKHWEFQRLPGSHPILHCYFDFDRQPPGWATDSKLFSQDEGWDTTPYLDAVIVDGEAVVLKTHQAYMNS